MRVRNLKYAVFVLFLFSCTTVPVPENKPESTPEQVKLDAAAGRVISGRSNDVTLTAFTSEVGRFLASGRRGSAERLVKRFPAIAMRCNQMPEKGTDPTLQYIATVHAQQCGGKQSNYEQAYRMLKEGEEQGRGKDKESPKLWLEAATLEASLLAEPALVADPDFWERCFQLKPVETNWPENVRLQFAKIAAAKLNLAQIPQGEDSESFVFWATLGFWRLERGEGQPALISFGRAEAKIIDENLLLALRFQRAKALILTGETAAARAVLSAVVLKDKSAYSKPALALLGSIDLKLGEFKRGRLILEKALEGNQQDWPERAEAEANLGLAYLMEGQSSNGLRWLHQSQSRFESQRDWEGLVQSLQNEILYFESSHKLSEIQPIQERLTRLEQ